MKWMQKLMRWLRPYTEHETIAPTEPKLPVEEDRRIDHRHRRAWREIDEMQRELRVLDEEVQVNLMRRRDQHG